MSTLQHLGDALTGAEAHLALACYRQGTSAAKTDVLQSKADCFQQMQAMPEPAKTRLRHH